jgi:hypothetical protein
LFSLVEPYFLGYYAMYSVVNYVLHAGFSLGLFFDTKDGSGMLLQNVG